MVAKFSVQEVIKKVLEDNNEIHQAQIRGETEENRDVLTLPETSGPGIARTMFSFNINVG